MNVRVPITHKIYLIICKVNASDCHLAVILDSFLGSVYTYRHCHNFCTIKKRFIGTMWCYLYITVRDQRCHS